MNKKVIRFLIEAVIVGLLLFLDQLAKIWAVVALKDGEIYELIPGVLELNYLENQGAAFGILQKQQTFFILASAIILFIIIIVLFIMPHTKRYYALNVLLVFIAAGAIGNMIDRIRYNYVIDFIYIRAINFPIFNLADCYVTVSTIVLCLLILFHYKEEDFLVFSFKNKRVN